LALLSHADKGDAGNQVRLMSMHAAKGLEFRFVFIVGVEDGNLPHEASIEEGRIDEERRLFYVGITRARERLWLSHAKEAQRWGDRLRLKPSRFLGELPAEELQRDGADPEADAAHKAERRSTGFANTPAPLADRPRRLHPPHHDNRSPPCAACCRSPSPPCWPPAPAPRSAPTPPPPRCA